MKRFFATLFLGAGCLSAAHATNYYVSSGTNSLVTGVDQLGSGRGLSASLPFRTIQFAADQAQAGDVVYVRQGTYTNPNSYSPVVEVKTPGTSAQPVVFRNYPSDTQKPLLKFNGWQAVLVKGGLAYVEINGFRVQGNNSAFNNADGTINTTAVATAANQPGGCNNPAGSPQSQYNGNGIDVKGEGTNYPHHLRILNNEVFECGGAGIAINDADYVTIDRNVTYNNCWYTIYGTSGISINASRNLDTAPGYHMTVTHNRSFGNRLYVAWYNKYAETDKCKGITDGNGIILDLNTTFNYTGQFLVANNLCVANGGAGIQVFKTKNVDVINNTLYRNSRSPELRTIRGEVYTNGADRVRVQNNILSTNAGAKVNGNYATTNLTYTNNLYFNADGSAQVDVVGANAIQNVDPLFSGAGTNWTTANFALKTSPASPAINKGVNSYLNTYDLAGNPRVTGGSSGIVDLGAYESGATSARTAPASPAASSVSAGTEFTAYPNPFSGPVSLTYTLPQAGPVRLEVFDLYGQRVALLVNEAQEAGLHKAQFQVPGQRDELYQVRLTTAQGSSSQKLTRQP